MTPEEFKAWRSASGLSLREAAQELGINALTVQHYERGFRHDDGRPVIIPKAIELACETVTRNLIKRKPRMSWRTVPEPMLMRIHGKLKEDGKQVGPYSIAYQHSSIAPIYSKVMEWLFEFPHQRHCLYNVEDPEAEGGSVYILEFADLTMVTIFILTWGEALPEDEAEQKAISSHEARDQTRPQRPSRRSK
jgi:hypothetical protein